MNEAVGPFLTTMPLHAITTNYGESGLRERFAVEITRFPSAQQRRLTEALELAATLHAADRRQREPYLNHLLRVAIRVMSHYGIDDPDVICAALLHDSVEDHAAELSPAGTQAAAIAELAEAFGPRVAELVAAVTNPEFAADHDRDSQYREHVISSLQACPSARPIKVSDFTDNAVGLIHTTGPKLVRLAQKYAPLVPVLRALIGQPDTPLSDNTKAMISGQLDRAQDRLTALLAQSHPAAATRSEP